MDPEQDPITLRCSACREHTWTAEAYRYGREQLAAWVCPGCGGLQQWPPAAPDPQAN